MLFISFSLSLLQLQKKPRLLFKHKSKRNKSNVSLRLRGRKCIRHSLQTVSVSWWRNASFTFSLLQTDVKQGGGSVAVSVMFGVFAEGADVRNLALLNPGEPPWAAGAPVSNKYQQKALAPHNNTIKSPPNTEILSSRDSDSSYHNSTDPLSWIIPILRSDCWVPAGHDCRHRWESRPVMTSICHIALLSRCVFLNVFLSISHLFLCFAL